MKTKSSDRAREKLTLTLIALKVVKELLAILGMVINYSRIHDGLPKTSVA